MPIRPKGPKVPANPRGIATIAPKPVNEKIGLAQKTANFFGMLPRILGGFLSAEGGPPGAAIGVAAEGVGQAIENIPKIPAGFEALYEMLTAPEDPNPEIAADVSASRGAGFVAGGIAEPAARMGVEAAISSVPAASLFKTGKVIGSALRSGALSGVGETGRELARGEDLSPGRIVGATALGGVVGGALGKFLPDEADDYVSWRQTNKPSDRFPTRASYEEFKAGRVGEQAKKAADAQIAARLAKDAARAKSRADFLSKHTKEIEELNTQYRLGRESKASGTRMLQKDEDAHLAGLKEDLGFEMKALENLKKSQAKEAARLAEIKRAEDLKAEAAERGLEAQPTKVSSSISGKDEAGARVSGRVSYAQPKPDGTIGEEGGAVDLLDSLLSGRPIPSHTPVPSVPNVPGTVTPPTGLAGTAAPVAAGPRMPEIGRSTKGLLPNLDPEALEDFTQRVISGTPQPTAYREAYQAMSIRIAKAKYKNPPVSGVGDTIEEVSSVPPTSNIPQAAQAVDPNAPLPSADDAFAEAKKLFGVVDQPAGSAASRTRRPTSQKAFDKGVNKILEGIGQPPVQAIAPDVQVPNIAPPVAALEVPAAPVAAPEAQVSELLQILTKPQDRAKAVGDIYFNNMKPALAAGEVPKEVARSWGARAQKMGKEAGLPTHKQQVAPKVPGDLPPVNSVPGREVTHTPAATGMSEMDRLTELEKLTKQADDPNFWKNSERGAADLELLANLLGGGIGAATGAALDASEGDDSFIDGTLEGAAAGLGLVNLPKIFANPQVRQQVWNLYTRAPQWMRSSLLYSIDGLIANGYLGPYGNVLTGGLEDALTDTLAGRSTRGWDAIREAGNPWEFGKAMGKAGPEARRLLEQGELGRAEGLGQSVGPASTWFNKAISFPGNIMMRGDVAARQALERAGYPEPESRIMTMTNEALTDVGRQTQNWGKGGKLGPLAETFFPFRRTPVNIVEQGAERLPVVGAIIHMLEGDPEWQRIAAQQGISAAFAVPAYFAGKELPPEQARIVRKMITNFSGRYSLGTGAAFTLGQMQNPQDTISPIRRLQTGVDNSFPLPTTETLGDISLWLSGKAGLTKPTSVPASLVPRQLSEALEGMGVLDKPGRGSRLRPHRSKRETR